MSSSSFRIFVAAVLLSFSGGAALASDVPVSIEFRQGLTDHHTYAARITNTSDKPVTVKVLMTRSNGKSSKTFDLTIAPQKTKEIGKTQGWKTFSGDRVTVSGAGFSAFSQEVP